jgi:hypothetical protein
MEHHRDWRAALAAAAYSASGVDPSAARSLADTVLDLDPDAADAAAVQAHMALASCAMQDGQGDAVERHTAEAMRITVPLAEGSDVTAARLVATGPIMLAGVGRIGPARRAVEQVVDIADRMQSPLVRFSARVALGFVLEEAGEHEQALPVLESITYGGGENEIVSSLAWNAMARARAAVGGPEHLDGFRAALVRHRQLGDDWWGLGPATQYLADWLERSDQPEDAARLDGWSHMIFPRLSPVQRLRRAQTLARLGQTLGPDRLARLQADGRACTADQIVTIALAAIDRVAAEARDATN